MCFVGVFSRWDAVIFDDFVGLEYIDFRFFRDVFRRVFYRHLRAFCWRWWVYLEWWKSMLESGLSEECDVYCRVVIWSRGFVLRLFGLVVIGLNLKYFLYGITRVLIWLSINYREIWVNFWCFSDDFWVGIGL